MCVIRKIDNKSPPSLRGYENEHLRLFPYFLEN